MNALFIGNGINRVSNLYSWENLLDELWGFVNDSSIHNHHKKPFPMFYEEIYLHALQNKNLSELELKLYIIDKIEEKITPGLFHKNLESLPFSEIITTNYDYNIEKGLSLNYEEATQSLNIFETRYSLFRCKTFKNQNIWHIHGELDQPNTIMLGYEHYSGYLQNIRSYYFNGGAYTNEKIPRLLNRLKNQERIIYSWVDHFFVSDISILGLDLDFIEMHLWWLLDYRARMQYENQKKIQNTITYFYPSFEFDKIIARLEMFKICNVQLEEIESPPADYEYFYARTFDILRQQ